MAGIIISKGSGLNDTIFGKYQGPVAKMVADEVEAFEKDESMIGKIFNMENTSQYAETLTSETSLGNMLPVGEAGAYPTLSFQEGYSITHEPDTWKGEFEITAEMVEDARMGKIKQRSKAFTLSRNRTRESFGAQILFGGALAAGAININGRTFNTKSADGVPFFYHQHTSKTGGYGTQTNLYANAFSYDALSYLQEKMQNLRDDDGNILGINPDTIIIPNDAMLYKAVCQAIGSELEPDTANNAINHQQGGWNVVKWRYLNPFISSLPGYASYSATKPWILMDSKWNEAFYGAVWYDRVPLTVRSDIASNDNNIWKGRERYTAGFNNWRGLALSYTGATNGTDATA